MADPRDVDPEGTDFSRVLLPNLTVTPLEVVVNGNQSFVASWREDLPGGGRNSSDLSFACVNGLCETTDQKTSGGSGHFVFAFYRPLPLVGPTSAKATFFLTGLQSNHTTVTFNIKAGGETIPLASKKNTTSAFTLIPKPTDLTRCPVEDSNDDKFWMGRA
jgi:hypothetical protein